MSRKSDARTTFGWRTSPPPIAVYSDMTTVALSNWLPSPRITRAATSTGFGVATVTVDDTLIVPVANEATGSVEEVVPRLCQP
ncbi:MAG: hypothetical protein AABP62_15710 [Planctomycetota bacterium]